MKNLTVARDYEKLSAYLDNQLAARERAQLEARIRSDPGLQKQLREIEETRMLLRRTPRLRAPHNFFVTPELAGKHVAVRPTPRLSPVYGIVSAIATILLVMVVLGERLVPSSGPVALAPALESRSELLVATQVVEQAQVEVSIPPEAPPMAMMEAAIAPTEIPPTIVQKIAGEIATPTTIYLDAHLPTSTPEINLSVLNEQAASVTPEGTQSFFMLEIFTSGTPDTPTETQFPSSTPSSTYTPLPTDTPIPTASPTATHIPSLTPAPTDTPEPPPMVGIPQAPGPSDQAQEFEDISPAMEEPAETSSQTSNYDFMQYIVLAFELSLATLAIVAGVIAIIHRIRAGR